LSDGLQDLVLIGQPIPTHLIDELAQLTGAESVLASPPAAVRLRQARSHPEVASRCAAARLDFAYVAPGLRLSDFGLLATDMDSTLISIECIDEVADFAGKKAEVAAITEAAMQGRIDYAESLRQRVSLLAGLSEGVLARVFAERLRLNPGAGTLLQAARQAGLRTLLVSGGFSYFTERLKAQLGFDFAAANELEISDGRLTGRVLGTIVDAAGKARKVVDTRKQLGIERDAVITIGDGANDLKMMAESSLSVAYHAKPIVRELARVAIDHGGLDGLLALFEPA
jgi:phosphoserine phosphatase